MKTYSSQAPAAFSPSLQKKIEELSQHKQAVQLGGLHFSSPLLLAPMSGICYSAFRLLMQDLGAGGSVSEFVSCHGINYGNDKSQDMLYIDPREENVGIQLFGEDPQALAQAAVRAQEKGADFVDINMGCPVKKVVGKGGGSALLKTPAHLVPMLKTIKKELKVPLTIKIRMGWDADQINADEILKIAVGEGVEMVAIHGRTRAQQYTGRANWDYIESLASQKIIPLIGNGDLHAASQVRHRLKESQCEALMIARGCLRNPFIFLESLDPQAAPFVAQDYFEVIQRFQFYLEQRFSNERTIVVNLRKFIVWFAAGLPYVAQFRGKIFSSEKKEDVFKLTQDYFLGLGDQIKQVEGPDNFMCGGHG